MNAERLAEQKETLGKIVWGLDVDNTIFDSRVPIVDRTNSDFGLDFGPEDVNGRWWVRDRVFEVLVARGVNKTDALEQATQYNLWIWQEPDILRRAPFMPGAEAFLTKLRRAEAGYFFITSRVPGPNNQLALATYEQFEERLPWVDRGRLCVNFDPSLKGEEFKCGSVEKKGVDVHIDDYLEHARLILSRTSAGVYLLCSRSDADGFDHPRLKKFVGREGQRGNLKDVHRYLVGKGFKI